MSDNPPTLTEKMFRQRWIANSNSAERLLWVRYHPTLDDTLIGFFLLSSDAMLANAQRMRTITNLARLKVKAILPTGSKDARAEPPLHASQSRQCPASSWPLERSFP